MDRRLCRTLPVLPAFALPGAHEPRAFLRQLGADDNVCQVPWLRCWAFAAMVARTEAEVARAKQAILQKVRWNGRALKHAGSALRADREVVLAAVRQNRCALKHADAAMRADREVVLVASA